MPAFVPAPGIAEVVMHYGAIGGPEYNIYHVAHTDASGWSASQLATLGSTFDTWESGGAHFLRHAQITYLGGKARDLTTQFGAEAVWTNSISGSSAGAPLPNNVTIAIKSGTGQVGRSRRGRTFWIGLDEGRTTNDQITSSALSAIVTSLTNLMAAVNAISNTQMVILSSQENKVKLSPRVGRPILSWGASDTNLDSQRRRLTAHNVHR